MFDTSGKTTRKPIHHDGEILSVNLNQPVTECIHFNKDNLAVLFMRNYQLSPLEFT